MKKLLYILSLTGAMFILLTSELNYSTGSPGGRTGSPGDGGNTCTECHGGTANFQEGWITSNIPVDGYTPGETYTITATGSHSGVGKFGFEITSEDEAAQKVGTIIVTNADENQLVNGNTSITHKSAGTMPSGNSKTWMFDWTAPAEGTGNVTFYGAFNAANGNGNNTGDVIYTSSLAVPEASSSTTGTDEEFLTKNIKLYPNPANEIINVDLAGIEFKISRLYLFNTNGVEVREIIPDKKTVYRMDIANLEAGIYYLVINLENKKAITKQIVKL